MKNNPYWRMAALGGEIPEFFDIHSWQEAWEHSLMLSYRDGQNFIEKANWSHYDKMGYGLQRNTALSQVIEIAAPFLSSNADEDQRRALLTQATRQAQEIMLTIKPAIERFFLKKLKTGTRAEQAKVKRESLFWRDCSTKKADCQKIEQALIRDGELYSFDRLPSTSLYPQIKKKLRNKAKGMGWMGYAVDPTDTDTALLMKSEDNEELRHSLWLMMNENTPVTKKEVNKLLQARLHFSYDVGANNLIEHFDSVNDGLKFTTIGHQLTKSIKRCMEVDRLWRSTRAAVGATLTEWKPHNDIDAQKPWNDEYLKWGSAPESKSLNGREFPFQRVLRTIIPDMLQMGGWKTIGLPKRLGRSKNSLYLYRLHKNGQMAMLYFAPFPGRATKDSDAYQAFACMMRERWMPNGKTTTPIAFISGNLSLIEGGLDDTEHLRILAHEIGHALHFLSLPGETFEEYARIPTNIGELPSVLFERLAFDPKLLQKWCAPQYCPGKKLSHWNKNKISWDMEYHVSELERASFDLMIHKSHNPDLVEQHRKLRHKTGMDPLHPLDKSAYTYFDRTDSAGLYSSYRVGHALTVQLLGKSTDAPKIVKEMTYLLDHVLGTGESVGRVWKKAYNRTLLSMYVEGQENNDKLHIKEAKKQIAVMKKTING